MAMQYGKKFKQIVRGFRKEFPLTRPLRIVGKCLGQQRLCGCCLAYLNQNGTISRFVIEIDNNLSMLTAIDTLIHEYAHALDQDHNGVSVEPHRASWGICYAQLWRFFSSNLV